MKTREMALHFLDSVREDIGDPAYWNAIWTNVNFPKQGVCRLHDWCDANMNMMDTIWQFSPEVHSEYWGREESPDGLLIEQRYESIWNAVYNEAFVLMSKEVKGDPPFTTIGRCTICGNDIVGPSEAKFNHTLCGAHD